MSLKWVMSSKPLKVRVPITELPTYIGGEKIKTDRVKQHTRTRPILVKKYYLANLLVPFMGKNLNSTFQVVECFLNIKTQVNLIGKKFIIIKILVNQIN